MLALKSIYSLSSLLAASAASASTLLLTNVSCALVYLYLFQMASIQALSLLVQKMAFCLAQLAEQYSQVMFVIYWFSCLSRYVIRRDSSRFFCQSSSIQSLRVRSHPYIFCNRMLISARNDSFAWLSSLFRVIQSLSCPFKSSICASSSRNFASKRGHFIQVESILPLDFLSWVLLEAFSNA